MIQVFIGTLIIQMLAGFTFKNYIQITFYGSNIVWSTFFNLFFSGFVIILSGAYAYAVKNYKNRLDQIQETIKSYLKYMLIINVIGVLLSQICLMYTNKAYFYFFPAETGFIIQKTEQDISKLDYEDKYLNNYIRPRYNQMTTEERINNEKIDIEKLEKTIARLKSYQQKN